MKRTPWWAVALLGLSLFSTLSAGAAWWLRAAANATIMALDKGSDIAVAADEAGPKVAARGLFLIREGRVDEAQALAERMTDRPAQAVLLYALGNAHMRRALMVFNTAPIRQVAPLINLAKAEYRQALRIDPQNWDARYNYDIAAALVRDADNPPTSKGEEMAHERAYFPDIPGAPNGMP